MKCDILDMDNGCAECRFMLSALHYLKHDYAVAKKSIVNVNKYGNKSLSSTNLERLIEQY
jgi:hypothetical protein